MTTCHGHCKRLSELASKGGSKVLDSLTIVPVPFEKKACTVLVHKPLGEPNGTRAELSVSRGDDREEEGCGTSHSLRHLPLDDRVEQGVTRPLFVVGHEQRFGLHFGSLFARRHAPARQAKFGVKAGVGRGVDGAGVVPNHLTRRFMLNHPVHAQGVAVLHIVQELLKLDVKTT